MDDAKYTAVWVSHTSIQDFLSCPRAYYLKHVYRDPATNHKIKIMSPPLALGQAVHEVLESLSIIETTHRFDVPLHERLDQAWQKVKGEKGGFTDAHLEEISIQKAKDMLERVTKHPGPLTRLAVKINADLPHYWLSEEDGIILCGKIDWLEYFPDTNQVHIIDFKTGKTEESGESLQLPIYHLLVHNCQNRVVSQMSYWYIAKYDHLTPQEIPDLESSHEQILKIAKQIKLARQLQRFSCPTDGCRNCRPLERVIEGSAHFVGNDEYSADVYILPDGDKAKEEESYIL